MWYVKWNSDESDWLRRGQHLPFFFIDLLRHSSLNLHHVLKLHLQLLLLLLLQSFFFLLFRRNHFVFPLDWLRGQALAAMYFARWLTLSVLWAIFPFDIVEMVWSELNGVERRLHYIVFSLGLFSIFDIQLRLIFNEVLRSKHVVGELAALLIGERLYWMEVFPWFAALPSRYYTSYLRLVH